MGPLHGLKVIELAGIGPGPMAAMLLADMGATVLRVDRKVAASLGVQRPQKYDLLLRNRRSIEVDLKDSKDLELVHQLINESDILIEGFRPGVTERLGLGPDVCLKNNPKIIYGRITGWGQEGPLAQTVGHDINYIALTGALHATGRTGQAPATAINLVGDFAGGTLYLVMGILAALHEAKTSGKGQVIDAAMVDGVASLMTQPHGSYAAGIMKTQRGTNPTDTGAPFYDVYECLDGLYISLGAVETNFYQEVLNLLQLEHLLPDQWNRNTWPTAKQQIAHKIKTKTRNQWCDVFEGKEACFAPVLDLDEATQHPHLKSRSTYIDIDGVMQPAPAPRFSRSKAPTPQAFKPWNADEVNDILGPWLNDAVLKSAKKSGHMA